MKEIRSGSDILIRHSDSLRVDELPSNAFARRGPQWAMAPGDVTQALLDAMNDQGLHTDRTFAIRPAAASGRGRRRSLSDDERTSIEVAIGPGEDAVVLIEREGAYTWVFPKDTSDGGHRRSSAQAPATRSFDIEFPAQRPAAGIVRRGAITDFIVGQARAFVLRFAAQAVTGAAVTWLESDVSTGLRDMRGKPDQWTAAPPVITGGDPAQMVKVLLFLHGTFSSTLGSFSELANDQARGLLEAAAANYGAVIGFDHPTLSVDPGKNADDLLQELEEMRSGRALQIDVVSFSRGGLVCRALAGRLENHEGIRLGKTCFVAVPNAGTTLAEPANWHELVDFYTNIAMAALRVLGRVPGAVTVSEIAKEVVKSLGDFVRYLTSNAVDANAVPGLAAMRPGSASISELKGLPHAERFAVVADYEPSARTDLAGLPASVLRWIADGVIDDLLGSDNDLVVNTRSMLDFGDGVAVAGSNLLDFGVTSQIFHTVYFAHAQIATALGGWLDLPLKPDGDIITHRLTPPLPAADAIVGEKTSDDLVVITASEPLRRVLDLNVPEGPEFVVIQREDGNSYAFRPEEISELAARQTLEQALDLHEDDGSLKIAKTDPGAYVPLRRRGMASRFRSIQMDDGKPAAVIYKELEATLPQPAKPAVSVPMLQARGLAKRDMTPDVLESTAGSPTPDLPVACHFRAEIDKQLLVGKVSTIAVTISREMIEAAVRRGTLYSYAKAKVLEGTILIVEILPGENLEVSGERRAELGVPPSGKPQKAFFDVRAPKVGRTAVSVIFRQGPQPLTEIMLEAEAVAELPSPSGKTEFIAAAQTPSIVPALNQLRISGGLGEPMRFEYELSLPGIILQRFESEPIGKREDYIADVYSRIERSYLDSKDDLDILSIELRARGDTLFRELLPPSLQALLWEHRERIKSIQVISREPFIPWELVFVSDPHEKGYSDDGKFLCEMGLTRWIHGNWPPQSVILGPDGARYLRPDYLGSPLPEAKSEAEFLEALFGATSIPATLKDIYAILRKGDFDLLHFVCHGEADQSKIWNSELLIQEQQEANGKIKQEKLRSDDAGGQMKRLKGKSGSRPLVMINACQTGREGYKLSGIGGFATEFLNAEAGIFVGTLWSVVDGAAFAFAKGFYTALCEGKPLAEAATAGRKASSEVEPSSWLAYAVYGDPYARLVMKNEKELDT
jgi:hypothetical protein